MKFARFFGLAVAGLFLIAMTSNAHADKRVALIIGNGNYHKTSILPNATHDAGAVGALFRVMGFDLVDAKFDLGIADLRGALRDFSDQVQRPISPSCTTRGMEWR